MELIFNELSLFPPSRNDFEVDKVFHGLLLTFRETNKRYGFNHIRFPQDYSNFFVTPTKTFHEWVYSITDFTLRNTILSIVKKPFVETLEDEELAKYFSSDFELVDQGVPTHKQPLGLPIAHIKSVPAISLKSHEFWTKRKIPMSVLRQTETDSRLIEVYNLCDETDIDSSELEEWGKNFLSVNLREVVQLKMYLSFKNYEIKFSGNFFEQLLKWRAMDSDIFKNLLDLMKDVEEHPFVGGLGKTEALKYTERASKRITHGDRLIYSLQNNIVTFFECKSHYGDR